MIRIIYAVIKFLRFKIFQLGLFIQFHSRFPWSAMMSVKSIYLLTYIHQK